MIQNYARPIIYIECHLLEKLFQLFSIIHLGFCRILKRWSWRGPPESALDSAQLRASSAKILIKEAQLQLVLYLIGFKARS